MMEGVVVGLPLFSFFALLFSSSLNKSGDLKKRKSSLLSTPITLFSELTTQSFLLLPLLLSLLPHSKLSKLFEKEEGNGSLQEMFLLLFDETTDAISSKISNGDIELSNDPSLE